eukprot:TRINITY_DN2778_c0_g1_i1.p1 TRINITY_DN2778_c0_g1~~TRINITY_DN2778_c0_g1_i1.p1  ORF type:complete len:832 (-),score=92.75 TRINITY_DN2778_c0_g1_i1:176-2329(-)
MSRECSKSTKKSHTIRTFRKHCNLTEGEVRVIGPSGISYKDVGKGESNTGYMLASLMAIAHAQPKVIEDMFVDRHLWPKNVYKTKWFYHGREINVSVDNMIPAKKKYEPWFTQFSNSGEVWPMVVEKAWAKLHSSFGLVFGGYQLDFMSAVTQAPMEFVKHADHTTDLLWAKLVNGTRDGFAMTARVSKTEKSALSKDAVYAVLKSGMPGGKRSVLVANPNSPDTSKTAWMTLEEYHRKFGQTDMCQIHKNYELASIPFKPGKTAHQFKIQVLSAKSFWVSLAKPTGHQMSTYLSKEGCKREWYDFDTSFVAHRHVVERKSKPIAGWGIGHIVSAKVVAGTADDYWSVRASAMPKATAKEGSVVDNLYLTVYAPLGAMKLIGKGNLSTSSPPNPQASPTPSPTPTPTPSPAPTPAPSPSPPEEVKTVRVAITGYTAVAALAKPITCGSGQIVASKSVAHGTNSNCEARDMCKIEVDSDCRVRVYMYDRCRSVRSRYSWSAFSSTSATSGNCKAKVIKDKPEVTYVPGVFGRATTGCTGNLEWINNEAECRKAAHRMGYRYWSTGHWSHEFKGCMVRPAERKVWFNTYPNPTGTNDARRSGQLCKKEMEFVKVGIGTCMTEDGQYPGNFYKGKGQGETFSMQQCRDLCASFSWCQAFDAVRTSSAGTCNLFVASGSSPKSPGSGWVDSRTHGCGLNCTKPVGKANGNTAFECYKKKAR